MEDRYEPWLSLLKRVARRQRDLLHSISTREERAVAIGQGASGDETLAIDQKLEQVLLEALDDAPHPVTVLTEEAGFIGSGEATLLVDPLDGSLNARSFFPAYAFSAALAHGPHVRDIGFAYVFDLATGDEFIAQRNLGAWCNGRRIAPSHSADSPMVLAFESVEYDPLQLAAVIAGLTKPFGAFRSRILGSTALSLCYAALGRVDAVVSSGECRVIDFAGAQLIAREAGLSVGCLGEQLDDIPFSLERVHRINAAATDLILDSIDLALDEAISRKR